MVAQSVKLRRDMINPHSIAGILRETAYRSFDQWIRDRLFRQESLGNRSRIPSVAGRISHGHRQPESDGERHLSDHHTYRRDDDAGQLLARCSKNLRSSFESFRTNGAIIECTGVSPIMLSPSRHTNRPYFAVADFCNRSFGIPAGSIIVVPGPLASVGAATASPPVSLDDYAVREPS